MHVCQYASIYACTHGRMGVELQFLSEFWRGRTVNLEFEHFAIVQRSFSAFGFLEPISAGLWTMADAQT